MQKVAWPITIVQSEGVMWWRGFCEKNELSAIPVTTPGSAIGSTSRNVIASRPKKRKRLTAAAAAVPRTSANAVASPAALNHLVLKPAIRQLWMLEELNA